MVLIPLRRVCDEFPGWPFSYWSTTRLIREGKLATVRVGRRLYVTAEILTEFVERLTERTPTASDRTHSV